MIDIKFIPASKYTAIDRAKANAELSRFEGSNTLPIVANDIYIPHFDRIEQLQMIYGGYDSGKSDWKATELLLKALTKQVFKCKYARLFKSDTHRSQTYQIASLVKRNGLSEYFRVDYNSHRITCLLNGNFLQADGLDNKHVFDKLPDFTDVWLEEPIQYNADILPEQIQIIMQHVLDGLQDLRVHFTFNPYSIKSTLFTEIFNNQSYRDTGVLWSLRTTVKDNFFAHANEASKLESLLTRYKTLALGEWGDFIDGILCEASNPKKSEKQAIEITNGSGGASN